MSRRLAREIALQTLFQLDFLANGEKKMAIEAAAAEHQGKIQKQTLGYADVLVDGIMEQRQVIDDVISNSVKGWTIERLGNTDKNILRLAIYEMQYAQEKIDPAIAINEAVELAKLYCDADAPKFINGVLAQIVKDR